MTRQIDGINPVMIALAGALDQGAIRLNEVHFSGELAGISPEPHLYALFAVAKRRKLASL